MLLVCMQYLMHKLVGLFMYVIVVNGYKSIVS